MKTRNNLLIFSIGRRWFRSLDWLGTRKQLQLGSLRLLRDSPLPNPSFMRRGSHWCGAPLDPNVQFSHANRPWPLHRRRGHGGLHHRSRHWCRRRRGLRRVPPPGDHLLHRARLGDACRRPDLTAGRGGGGTHRGRGRSGLPPRAPGVPGPGSGGHHNRGGRERRGRRRRAARRGGLEGCALVLVEVAADARRGGKEGRHRGGGRSRGGRGRDRDAGPCDCSRDGGRGCHGAVCRARGAATREIEPG